MRSARISALAFALFASANAVAAAHAYIVDTRPPMNEGYVDPKGAVSVSFDEPIDIIDANALRVEDATGDRVDRGDAAIDPNDATRLVVHVPRNLRPGVYTVHWRVISADTHVVHGVYRLGVMVSLAKTAIATDSSSLYDPSGALATIARALSLLGATLATGAALLRIFVIGRLLTTCDFRGYTRKMCLAGAAIVLVAAPVSLVIQASAASGSFGTGLWPTLVSSQWGDALLVRTLAAVVMLVASAFERTWSQVVAGLCGIVMFATFSAAGHALAVPDELRVVSILMDAAHGAAAATWIGGLFVMLGLVYFATPKHAEPRVTRMLFASFTPVALCCVCVIAATGLYAWYVHVHSIAALVTTLYGRLVLAKIALFIALLAFGYRHMRAGCAKADGFENRSLLFESVVGMVVLLVTASLVGQMPPSFSAMPSTMLMSQ
jgi:copper transport protein